MGRVTPFSLAWARICKLLKSPGIDSKESILPAYVARAEFVNLRRSPGIDSQPGGPVRQMTTLLDVPARQAT